jgi:glycosyltransferase involved in cell wall biosynthesis
MNTNPQTLLVVMPVYNGQRTLSMAIESILNQSYRNIKLVIIDDCSTDNTLQIASMYLGDGRVSVYTNKQNMGAYYSRNVGLYLFRNKNWGYFTTHDSDDISFEHRYIKLIRMIKKPRTTAVQDTFRRIEMSTGKVLGENLTMAHAVFNRQAFDAIGYFENVRFGGDWEHWTRLAAWNKINRSRTLATADVLGESFIHDNNLTVQIPLGSYQRSNYIKDVRRKMKTLAPMGNYYYSFSEKIFCTERVS